ncbi:MAG: peptidase M23 family protein [Anaerolineaceae bacterium]|nr:MAG: peptidase M23 family protein [Anaerolineaceae bacterium]
MNLLKDKPRLFNIVSWGLTALVVLTLAGVTVWRLQPAPAPAATEPAPTESAGTPSLPAAAGGSASALSITRHAALKTIIPTRQPYAVVEYTVSRGDSLFGIAADFNIKPETLYWANSEVFSGSPDSLKPGDVLRIPPVDGVFYKWQEGDTFQSVAAEFDVEPDVIMNWPGNNLDLTDPQILVGASILIPGAERNDQPLFIQTVTVANTAAGQACGGGFAGRDYFTWPTALHSISGYDWLEGGSHRGIDISAQEGTPIYAADNGVVTMANVGGWNYGYGNVIQIDHGNGFVTVYAHLSAVFVAPCTPVLAGSQIGAAGNTGNSSGAHLHFEIRYGGSAVNPWNYLP